MIRNLKILLLAALAVTAFSALSVSVAQATKFTAPGGTTTTVKAAKDGTGKTAHQVFDIYNAAKSSEVSFTCEEITGSGTIAGESTEEFALVTPGFSGHCTVAGQETLTITNLGCNLQLNANGTAKIVSEAGHNCAHSLGSSHEAGKEPITLQTGAFNCTIEIGAQTLAGKVKFHNLTNALVTVKSGEGETITVEFPTPTPTGFIDNAFGTGCPFGTQSNGQITTSNFILQGFKPNGTQQVIRWDEI